MSQNNTLETVKLILEDDPISDNLLIHYIQNAKDYIYDYTRVDKIPSTLNTVIVDMVVFQYRNKGVENVTTESKGSLYESFTTEYPAYITNRLKPYKRALFL